MVSLLLGFVWFLGSYCSVTVILQFEDVIKDDIQRAGKEWTFNDITELPTWEPTLPLSLY